MGGRKKKCPSCGLVNFHDASPCQWCALALQDRVRNELVDDRPAARGPWGAALIMLALAILCGGVVWHLTRKAVVRGERLATEALGPDAAKKQAKRTGPPALSGRSPGDNPAEIVDPIKRQIEEARKKRASPELEEFQRQLRGPVFGSPEQRRRIEEQRARQRQIEEQLREAEEQPDPPPDTPDDR